MSESTNRTRMMSAAAQAVFVLSIEPGYGGGFMMPPPATEPRPWESKYAGKYRKGSSKRKSQEQSPKFMKTRKGYLKRMSKR